MFTLFKKNDNTQNKHSLEYNCRKRTEELLFIKRKKIIKAETNYLVNY